MFRPEILAPAGSYEAFLAAVHNGCDAVYFGGEKYGARAFAQNFDHVAIKRAVSYAHLFGVKVYFTINTLFKEKELNALLEEVNTLRTLGIQYFIVQDIGVIDLLSTTFDDIEIHASTQMNCHSIYGMNFLEQLGVARVVLSRELSIQEIIKIKEGSRLQIETFVHGALCYCYSGECLMSSMLGGRSGNRGRCAQPCRLKYKTIVDDQIVDQSYVLSPKDIQTLTILPELIDLGIHSFKIEGRMKSKEYVGLMTKLYKHYTIKYIEDGFINVEQQDINDMTQIFNRGDFSNGYYNQLNGPSMMTTKQPKNQGVVVGKVIKQKGLELGMTFFEPIKKGDCIELSLIDGSYHSFIADTDMHNNQKVLARTLSLVKEKSEVRRIKSVELNERIANDNDTIYKTYISFEVTLTIDEPIRLKIFDEKREIIVDGDLVQLAKNQGLTVERIEKQFLKVGNYPVLIDDIKVKGDSKVFVPIGQLNALRRIGLEKWFDISNHLPESIDLKKRPTVKNISNNIKNITVLIKNRHQLEAVLGYSVKRVYLEWFNFERLDIEAIINECHDKGVEVYIALPKIVRQENDYMIHIMLDELPKTVDGYLVRSMDSYMLIKDQAISIQWDYGVSVLNAATVNYLLSIEKSSGYCPSLELNKGEMKQLPLEKAEIVIYGNTKTMTSAQCVRKNTTGCVKDPGKIIYIEDRKGMKVPVETICQLCYNNIYNGIPLYLLDKLAELSTIGCSTYRVDLLNEDGNSVQQLLNVLFDQNQSQRKPIIEPFTRGHYNKGVE